MLSHDDHKTSRGDLPWRLCGDYGNSLRCPDPLGFWMDTVTQRELMTIIAIWLLINVFVAVLMMPVRT
jgi:hypothetical protein